MTTSSVRKARITCFASTVAFVRSFGRGYVEEIGGDYVSIQLASLDDMDPLELVNAPIKYANGRDNSWWTSPSETRQL